MATATPDTGKVFGQIYSPTLHHYHLKMLIYGNPGVGKTTLAATAVNCPAMREVLMVNVEGGIMSVVGANEVGLEVTPDIIDLNGWKNLEEIFWYLRTEKHAYKTLVIDSLSELAVVNLDHVVQSQLQSNSRKKDADDIWLEDYGRNTSQMRRVIRAFRDLPMNVIFTCHAGTSQDSDRNEQVFPSLTPKLRESVIGYMDVVAYMYTQAQEEGGKTQIVRRLLTQPHGKFVAKDRSPGGRLGLVIDNPNMSMIVERIAGPEPATTKNGK